MVVSHCAFHEKSVENVKACYCTNPFLDTAVGLTCMAMCQVMVLKLLCRASHRVAVIRGKEVSDPFYSMTYVRGEKGKILKYATSYEAVNTRWGPASWMAI